jgi:hypothetical protein
MYSGGWLGCALQPYNLTTSKTLFYFLDVVFILFECLQRRRRRKTEQWQSWKPCPTNRAHPRERCFFRHMLYNIWYILYDIQVICISYISYIRWRSDRTGSCAPQAERVHARGVSFGASFNILLNIRGTFREYSRNIHFQGTFRECFLRCAFYYFKFNVNISVIFVT